MEYSCVFIKIGYYFIQFDFAMRLSYFIRYRYQGIGKGYLLDDFLMYYFR